ncbi:acyl-CoA dehydrogenase family protein [Mycolicibacterium holsaticum]|uniref:acyl-CoA dehydrogenase family protein n=1 Tax=Mycolicibacterium holsaticum TaxID=152142 RepID=UPI001C7CCC0A|nr:acyl-CoA dehydrogenase family protein [Mycolicibacterium holsaticum]MDA4108523.1 acyl-CoA dehydrogenase [Mycolicibacterium holsaticum DSM 44478 = JCM 12374]QZA12732.1 acyl-CoA dehydrogenase family protein [Mycolicibacterium holsaticum DSM 44478 = JCM 12374]UNC09794.1 acyl-CoA dehydrogenase family protein [Mycolicibacterium holsaticum DSM 44478 = JCM 12374]
MTDQAAEVDRRVAELLTRVDPRTTDAEVFLGEQFDAGLAYVDYPLGKGGLGFPAGLQRRVDDQLDAAGAHRAFLRNPLGVGMLPLTLLRHGSDEQQQRYLRPAFIGEEIWCQLFSEPGAGSDLAGLSTRAVRDGAEWVVNGQKIWTSLAHKATWGMLLARTNPGLPKHDGITYFVVNMRQPGIDVRPLKQLNGQSDFNEVFLDDVRVPDTDRIDAVGKGWAVARTTLSSERAALSGAGTGAANIGGSAVERLVELAVTNGRWHDPVARAQIVDLVVESTLIRLTNQRSRAALRAGRSVGAEGAATKVGAGLHNRRLQGAFLDIAGPAAMSWDDQAGQSRRIASGYLRAQANTIEGGASNVLRDVLAERVLGMPRDPGELPRSTPWKDIPRR